jgi:GMP synthase-like glutamine amidotransferase
MRIHILQHEVFEEPGYILEWARAGGHEVNFTRFYMLMGGPMGIYDENLYPWLIDEKKFIDQAIALQKKIVGVCLGSQLLANALGARVYRNPWKEIGFFEVMQTGIPHPVIDNIPNRFVAFHWHGDTFDLPAECSLLYSSEACKNQMFIWKNQLLGLQFHLEVTPSLLNLFLDHADNELQEKSPFIQPATEMQQKSYLLHETNSILGKILDNFVKL